MFLSLFRERLLNANFGVSSLELDAYRAAFKVPDFMFVVLVSGALSVTFIPVFTQRLAKGNKDSAWELSSSLLNTLAIVTIVASVLIMIFAAPIVHYLLAPHTKPEGQQMAITMMRIIAINPMLFAVSSVLTSIQQAVGRFFFFALAPAIYSAGIIFGILFLAPKYGIYGVALGVVIGSLAQLLVALTGMIGLDFKYHPKINWRHRGFRQVLRMLPQRSLDQGIDYFNSIIEMNLASRLKTGLINAWEVAFTLHYVPINLIGVAISTAAFPQMTERLGQGRPDLFKREFISVLRVIIWLALPAVLIAFFGRGYIVRLLVAEGNQTIADLLGLLVLAIFFRSIFHIATRSFYAQQDTRTPLLVSIVTIALNIVIASYLVLKAEYGVYGLAVAQSFIACFEVVALLSILSKRIPGLFEPRLFLAFLQMAGAAILTGGITYSLIKLLPLRASDVGFFSLVPKFGLIVVLSLLTYIGSSYLFGVREAKPVIRKVINFIYRPIRIQ